MMESLKLVGDGADLKFTINFSDPIKIPDWNDKMEKIDDSSFFHSSNWAEVLHKTYGYEPVYLTIWNKEQIVGLVPFMAIRSFLTGRRAVSLPFSDYTLPLLPEGISWKKLWSKIITQAEPYNWKTIELRGGGNDISDVASTFFYVHHISLQQDKEALFKNFNRNTRTNIKKAEKEGLRVVVRNDAEAIDKFFKLNCINRKKLGVPPQPRFFFDNIYKYIFEPGLGEVVMIYQDENLVSAGMVFFFNKKVIFKYSALNYTYQSLRSNNLMVWEMIKRYSANGFESFCFGRTDPANEGLRRYKNNFGSVENVLNYYKFDLTKNEQVKSDPEVSELMKSLMQRSPVWLLKWVGSALYKHMA
ncbi:GNAT family N-acetyltransferase [Fulvivirgaceae bacterium BMA10]|uniref:GNAT family N-acetyltransferase n=1 Tax=Splendidivirga corallicola TaxID=3051826 RepID=A0ABT8KX81_9BACT|nr:GNAT family N-acetyltransferase [Fulvivirgaceae bacterium BMA10]